MRGDEPGELPSHRSYCYPSDGHDDGFAVDIAGRLVLEDEAELDEYVSEERPRNGLPAK